MTDKLYTQAEVDAKVASALTETIPCGHRWANRVRPLLQPDNIFGEYCEVCALVAAKEKQAIASAEEATVLACAEVECNYCQHYKKRELQPYQSHTLIFDFHPKDAREEQQREKSWYHVFKEPGVETWTICGGNEIRALLKTPGQLARQLQEQDEKWIAAMGWTDLVHVGEYSQSDRKGYVKLLVDSVTHNMVEMDELARREAEIRRQEREATIAFVACVEETALHAMCHGETYTLDEAMAALYRIHNKADELDIERKRLAELTAPPEGT